MGDLHCPNPWSRVGRGSKSPRPSLSFEFFMVMVVEGAPVSISFPGWVKQPRKNTAKNWGEGEKETPESSVEHLECASSGYTIMEKLEGSGSLLGSGMEGAG